MNLELCIRKYLNKMTENINKNYNLEMTCLDFFFFKHYTVEYAMYLINLHEEYILRDIIPAAYSLAFKYHIDYETPEGFLKFLNSKFNCGIYNIKKFEKILLKNTNYLPFYNIQKMENKLYENRKTMIKLIKHE